MTPLRPFLSINHRVLLFISVCARAFLTERLGHTPLPSTCMFRLSTSSERLQTQFVFDTGPGAGYGSDTVSQCRAPVRLGSGTFYFIFI